jgi:hypothetical protein
MPVESSVEDTIRPHNSRELQEKVQTNEHGAEEIVNDVQFHVSNNEFLHCQR